MYNTEFVAQTDINSKLSIYPFVCKQTFSIDYKLNDLCIWALQNSHIYVL